MLVLFYPNPLPLLSDYLSRLHHELHALQLGDVLQRIARYRDNVGELAGLDCAEAVLLAEQLRSDGGGGLDGLHRRHPILHHVCELFGFIFGPGETAHIGAEGDLYAQLASARRRLKD